MEKNRLKRANRLYLRKVFTLKTFFYSLMLLLIKTRLIVVAEKLINSVIRLSGVNKSIHYFLKYRDYGQLFSKEFSEGKDVNQEILFPMMFGVHSNFNLLNLLFAKYFKEKEGFNPVFYICDSAFRICTKDGMLKSREKYPWFCHECWNGYKFIESQTGIETIRMSSMLAKAEAEAKVKAKVKVKVKVEDEAEVEELKIAGLRNLSECYEYEHEGIKIGIFVRRSVLRYFLTGTLKEDEKVLRIFKKFLIAAIGYSIAFRNLLNSRPGIKYVILNNGSLSFEAIARAHCTKKEITYMTYETYIGNNSLIYKKNGPVMDLDWESEYESFKITFILDEDKKQKVKEFFDNLQKGVDMYAVLNKEHNSDKLAEVKRYACLFTNLNFDTAVIDKNYLFRNMEEWIFSVIDYWKNNKQEITLVIRIHPGELKLVTATNEFLGERIKNACEGNNRIIVFDSTDKVNSYELIKGMEYGLIYSSTIGLEIAWAGKPCLVSGLPWFRNKSFIIYPDSEDKYFKDIGSLNRGEMRHCIDEEELFRTIYFIYFNRVKRFNGIKFYTPKEEPNTVFDNPDDMIKENLTFFEEFRNELFSRNI